VRTTRRSSDPTAKQLRKTGRACTVSVTDGAVSLN
jgi:hypothetical protein